MNPGCRLVALTFIVTSTIFNYTGAFAQDIECQQLKALEQDLLLNLPVTVDEVTSLVGLHVNCTAREIQFVKRLTVSARELDKKVVARKQAQYVALHCNRDGFALKGWTTRDYIYDRDLLLVMELHASPDKC